MKIRENGKEKNQAVQKKNDNNSRLMGLHVVFTAGMPS
jgi:hypothetical protein